MTPDDPQSRARGGHPTDEDLSALLDGEAEPQRPMRGISPDVPRRERANEGLWGESFDAHVRRCAQCQARAGELRSAARAVAAPVPLPRAALRDDAIARAVAEAAGTTSAGRAPAARVVWLDRLRRPVLAGGAVAAAVAAVLAFALLPNRGGRDQQLASNELKAATTTQPGAAESAAAQDSAARTGRPPVMRQSAPAAAGPPQALATAGSAAGASAATTDLGAVNDGADLRARVGPAVQRRRAASDEATTFAAPADSQRAGEPQPAAAPAAGGTAGNAASAPGEPPPPYAGPPPACEAQARSLGPTADRLVYVATARWQESPAIVLAFVPEPPANGPARVYVMAEGDCRLLFSDVYEQ